MYHLFLDDYRYPKDVTWVELPPLGWTIVRTYKAFVDTITQDGLPKTISFDHDLNASQSEEYDTFAIYNGYFRYEKVEGKTGYHCAKWLVDFCRKDGLEIPKYYLHSLNHVGRDNIRRILDAYTLEAAAKQPSPPVGNGMIPSLEQGAAP